MNKQIETAVAKVKKRDGTFAKFDIKRIINAVEKAFESTGKDKVPDEVINYIMINYSKQKGIISVENIQDNIESFLCKNYYEVGKKFMLYRYQHNEDREVLDKLNFMMNYCDAENPATGSKYDANANVENKNIATLVGELPKSNFIRLNRKILVNRIEQMYGKELADRYVYLLTNHFIYKNDETNLANYCASITMYPWLLGGTASIGGNSTKPTNLKSFCGGFINMVFMVSSMLSGACMYKNQKLLIKIDGVVYLMTSKELIEKYFDTDTPYNTFDNYQGTWEYVYTTDKNIEVLEDNKFVKVTKVYRRKYDKNIYKISSSDGYVATVSEDHKFKQVYRGREFEVKSKDLHIGDAVYVNKDYSCILNTNSNDWKKGWVIGKNAFDKHIDVHSKSVDYLLGVLDGIICANGSIKEDNGIIISLVNKDLINNIKYIAEEVLDVKITNGINITEPHDNESRLYTISIPWRVTKYLSHALNKNTSSNLNNKETYNEVYHYGSNIGNNVMSNDKDLVSDSHITGRKELEVIDNIEVFKNDDDYVYEIETESHWYNCGGFITHNCATPEFLMYMDYFIRKEYGEDYYKRSDEVVDLSVRKRSIDKVISDCFEQVVYSLNQPTGARNFQAVFWNISYYDKFYFQSIFGDFKFPDGTAPVWDSLSWLQKRFMKWFNAERTKTVLTFPVESMALLSDNGEPKDKEYGDFTAEMYAEGHSFFTYMSDKADSLSSCCRLRNEIQNNGFSYTLGAGGVSTGSKSVLTINLNRCIQYAVKHGKTYMSFLEEIVDLVHKVQLAYNENLKELLKKGMLPLFDAGYININRQYLTIGVNGLVEGAEFLQIPIKDCDEYSSYVQSILGLVETYNKKYRTKEVMFNCEMIPAENVGVKHAKWDKEDGYFVPRDCYNSYFYIVEDENTNVIDKFKLHGKKYIEHLTGGSALHCNLDEHLSFEQYKQLLKVAAKEGCNYFTFNIPNTICNDCGTIDKRYLKKCPKCGSENVDYITRVIGYIKRVSNFSSARQKEAAKRYYADV